MNSSAASLASGRSRRALCGVRANEHAAPRHEAQQPPPLARSERLHTPGLPASGAAGVVSSRRPEAVELRPGTTGGRPSATMSRRRTQGCAAWCLFQVCASKHLELASPLAPNFKDRSPASCGRLRTAATVHRQRTAAVAAPSARMRTACRSCRPVRIASAMTGANGICPTTATTSTPKRAVEHVLSVSMHTFQAHRHLVPPLIGSALLPTVARTRTLAALRAQMDCTPNAVSSGCRATTTTTGSAPSCTRLLHYRQGRQSRHRRRQRHRHHPG